MSDNQPRIPKTFRLPRELVALLQGKARELKVSMTTIVEDALRSHLTASREGSKADLPSGSAHDGDHAARSAQAPREAPNGSVDLARWLQGRTGMPRALCERFVRRGSVTVAGEECRELEVSRDRLDAGVTLDGQAV